MSSNDSPDVTNSPKVGWVKEIQSTPRALTVREISSRFTGNSKITTETDNQNRIKSYRKIPSFAYVTKNSIKNLNSPRKMMLMKEWSQVVIEDKVGEVNPQSALDFLAQYDVTPQGMDEESWKEWVEAIEHATAETEIKFENISNEINSEGGGDFDRPNSERRPSYNHATFQNKVSFPTNSNSNSNITSQKWSANNNTNTLSN
jgi:hypothetical protein